MKTFQHLNGLQNTLLGMESEGWSRILRQSRDVWEGRLGSGSSGGRKFVGRVWEERRRGSVGDRRVSGARFVLLVMWMRKATGFVSRLW